MLTIAKLSRWSINYYNDTARAAGQAARDACSAGGGLGEYYGEHDTRTPVWVCVGDAHKAAELVGLSDAERAGGEADPAVVARWLDDGIAPSGGCGRALGKGAVHGFDLTFCAPKSVSLIRALRGDDVAEKAVLAAHATAIAEALEYLSQHAGYTRVHNPVTGEKDLVRLPGLVAIAYQHETSRAGDPHLHTHVLVPNRQARGDGKLVSVDGTSLYHEAKAAGVCAEICDACAAECDKYDNDHCRACARSSVPRAPRRIIRTTSWRARWPHGWGPWGSTSSPAVGPGSWRPPTGAPARRGCARSAWLSSCPTSSA